MDCSTFPGTFSVPLNPMLETGNVISCENLSICTVGATCPKAVKQNRVDRNAVATILPGAR
jgi:hypothetical protein